MNRNTNNNLINRFQSYQNNNVPFNNNPLLSNNPNFVANSRDASFYNKINMAKLDQIKRARNIDEIGMDKKQITDLIICPIVINKTKQDELTDAYTDIVPQYSNKGNKVLQEWWNSRTNQPYKNIIKKDLFNKDFKKYYKEDIFNTNVKEKKELLIHKITDADSDQILLESEFELLSGIIEKHNDELKVIYSSSKKNKYKKEFEYVQNYRYRLEYNPKDSEELKDFYKKEQKKINKEKQMIDDVITNLIENDQLTAEELDKINSEIKIKKPSKIENLEDELRKELGDDFDVIMDNIDVKPDINRHDDKKSKIKVETSDSKPRIKVSSLSSDNDNSGDLKPKKRIVVKSSTIKKEDNNDDNKDNTKETTNLNSDLKNKYKNRQ
jgi:hypothetical protein